MPHTIEVAKSGRSTCRGCRQKIEKGILRFGEEVPNLFSEEGGTTFRWWHLECGATKGKLANEVRDALKSYPGEVPDRAKLDEVIEKNLHADYPYAERAPNGRARCRVCAETIDKGTLRVAFERIVETGMGVQRGAGYVHSTCTLGFEDARKLGDAEAVMKALREHSKALPPADAAQLATDVAASASKVVETGDGDDESEL
jgi:hypothetical protein